MYDVVVVGAGIIGSAVAYNLSRYNLSVCVCERFNDVANGATKANSAIIHAGYDCPEGTAMARLNVIGSEMARDLCKKLDIQIREIPSLVLAFSEEEMATVHKLYDRGIANGVKGLKVLNKKQVLELEKNINPEVVGALYAPSAIVNPWEYAIAMAEVAARNGADFKLSCKVTGIKKENGVFKIETSKGEIQSKYIVNAAGAFSANIYKMVGGTKLVQTNPCGEYYVLDKDQGNIINSVIFQCPTKAGKGILVAPTVHGNLIVGPDSFEVEDADTVATSAEGLARVKRLGLKSVPSINFRQVIHEYAGVRPNCTIEDFVIEEAPECKGFINAAGIKSPGLSAAPAIALECVNLLKKSGLEMKEKEEFKDGRKVVRFRDLSTEEQAKVIEENPLYGRIICRCETVTEGEIVQAIHRPIVPTTIDAIKRRCNPGMGRCQGGFCSPRVHEILARELGKDPKEILMDEEGTFIITSEIKENSKK